MPTVQITPVSHPPLFKRLSSICESLKDVEIPDSNYEAYADKVLIIKEKKTQWKSIYIGGLIALMSSIQYSLYFTSLWPYMKQLDSTTKESLFGIVIGIYSLSQIITAPLLGYWSNRIGKIRPILIFCTIVALLGNLLYFCVELFPNNYNYMFLMARLIIGVGSSLSFILGSLIRVFLDTVGLIKTYAAAASLPNDRSKAISITSGGLAIGTIIGPSFQLFFIWIGYPGFNITQKFGISMYNAPALLATLMNILTMIAVIVYFNENFVGVEETINKSKNDNATHVTLPDYDHWGVFCCHAIRFTQMFVVTNLETIGSSYSMTMFRWTGEEAVFYYSFADVAKGVLAFIIYFFYIAFDMGKKINERLVCTISLLSLILFHLITFSYPFLPEHVAVYDNTTISNGGKAVGCNREVYKWCDSLTQINLWVYYIFHVLLIGTAFPNINVTMNTLFSKIIGPRLQGTQQGMLQMSGGISRLFGPVMMGFLYTSEGPRAVWISESIIVAITTLLWTFSYNHLVPLKVPPKDDICTLSTKVEITAYNKNNEATITNNNIKPPTLNSIE